METKKENPIKPSGSLLIKIFAGYTILALLVIGIIAALWHEKKVFAEAEAEENAMLAQRELTSRTSKRLFHSFWTTNRHICVTYRTKKSTMKERTGSSSCLMN